MNEQDRPQLSLGPAPTALHAKLAAPSRRWFVVLMLLQLAVLGGLAVLWKRTSAPSPGGAPADVSAELRAVAQDLEDRGLEQQAAQAWEAYLSAQPGDADRGKILYRVGRLHMQAEQFGPAAAALLRAERVAANDAELKDKIGKNLIECLNRLGRYGEAGRELSRRVEVGADRAATASGKKVLATISGQEFTEADLDRAVQRRIDRLLGVQPGAVDAQQRQAILKQMSTPDMRKQILQDLVQKEVFCRRARELGLDRKESYLQARDEIMQDLLASQFLMQELEKIKPTEVDIESFFKANAKRYEKPADEKAKTPARMPTLAEVRGQVRADYVARKQEELTRQLGGELGARYDVRIMPDAAAPAAKDEGEKREEKKDDRKTEKKEDARKEKSS